MAFRIDWRLCQREAFSGQSGARHRSLTGGPWTSPTCRTCATSILAPVPCAASARCTWICCRRATRPARRERTSRRGSPHMQAGRARAGVARAGRRQSVRGDPRAGLLSPVRERLQPRQSRQRGLDPLGRAVPGRSGARAGMAVRPAAGPQRQAGAGDRCRARAGCRPPTTWPGWGHEVEIRDAGAEPGGMMRYGIPAYRMPRDVLSGELERIAALGVRFDQQPQRRPILTPSAARAALMPCSSRSARICQSGWRSPRGCGADRGCGVVPARGGVGRAARDRASRRGLRRRQHGDGRRADGAPVGCARRR